MITDPRTLQDLELKALLERRPPELPSIQWGLHVQDMAVLRRSVILKEDRGDQDFRPTSVAQLIGDSLAHLLVLRGIREIETEANVRSVRRLTEAVVQRLEEQGDPTIPLRLSPYDLSVLVEATLIEAGLFDLAKSCVFLRSQQVDSSGETIEDVKLIRRNGKVVPWNPAKIEIAVRKAFLSLHLDSEPAVEIAQAVSRRVQAMGQSYVSIEFVQDVVQEELMRAGHYKVAEAYIVYRAQRAMMRASQSPQATHAHEQFAMVNLIREDGVTDFWDGEDLRRRIRFAGIGLDLRLDPTQIEAELRRSIPPDITVGDLKKTVILNAKSLIERDADFAKFAARILLTYIYEEVLDWDIVRDGIERLKEFHIRGFFAGLERGIELDRLAADIREGYDLQRLAEALDPTADLDFDYLGIQTLYDRYLLVDKSDSANPRRMETPQIFWMRVAMGLFRLEPQAKEERAVELYNLYKSRRFCSSTPTLFNSGTQRSQLSSCYLYKVDDSIESIMLRGIAENAFLSKWAGGLGGSWTSVRGTGGYIKGTNGESQGVIPFLKLHNDQLVAVNQGGKRAGSGCAYLETWHNDIFDFLELRRNTGDERRRTHDMNTANWIPDLFMKRMEGREDWTLFRSNEVPDLHDLYGKAFEERYLQYEAMAERGEIYGKKVEAIELWKAMLKLLFETGHPWITFKDPCNLRSPQDHVGVIHSSNLCTEITLNTSADETAVCNLGSVVLDSHLLPDGSLDHDKLRETVRVAVRALDNVIDINFYPTAAAERSNKRHRPIGLGVMGLHFALFRKGVDFGSEAAVEFNDEFMEAIAYYAYEASSDLAAERGKYETYAGSKWDRGMMPQDTLELLERERGLPISVPRGGKMDWSVLRDKITRQGMRNSNVLAIAPTATIANIMGTSPCIEPVYKNMFVKSNLSGDFVVLNPFMVRDLKDNELWTAEIIEQIKYFDGDLENIEEIPEWLKQKYRSAFAIGYEPIIDAAARRQKWIDQSQSVNLFLGSPDLKVLSHMYRRAWHSGLKTTYYLRTLGASNIEKATVGVNMTDRRTMVSSEESVEGGIAAVTPLPGSVPAFTPEQAAQCRIDNPDDCEACQ